ncbi:MAG: Bug family tripartite tricarboxylate transporter substrate binding protein [Burkholderiales bacterium]
MQARIIASILFAFVMSASLALQAQTYPAKPIRLILNVSVGVVADILMRTATAHLAQQMGQPWVVENRQGGNFVIGATACRNASADGYTVCLVNLESMSTNPHVFAQLPYDPDKDFVPITNLYYQVSGIVVSPSLPVNTMADLQALAIAKPGSLNFSTLGPGSNSDILRQWLGERWKTHMLGVPYKGMNLIVNALVSGESDLTLTSIGTVGAQLGKLKLLALNSAKRSPRLPAAPTFGETGLAEYLDLLGLSWWGLVAPTGVPDAIVQRLNAEFVRLVREPSFADLMDRQFLEPAVSSSAQFGAFLKADRERVGKVVKKFNFPRQ